MSRLERWVAVVFALLGALVSLREQGARRISERTFVVAPAVAAPPAPPFHEMDFVTPEGLVPAVHVASIGSGRKGNLHVAWYGGSKEGARDVRIFLSTRKAGAGEGWSAPRAVASAESAGVELNRHVRKVGNAVLFGKGDRLSLLFVTVAFGGWSGCSLNVKTSADDGGSWTSARRLVLSPLFNVSELVKNGPAEMSDGQWAVPIYHDLFGTCAEVLWLSLGPGDRVAATKTRIAAGSFASQPALVALSPTEALALLRDESGADRIHTARSTDAGRTWSSPEAADLPNPRSGLDAVRLSDGRVLLAFNAGSDRSTLALAVSSDGGRSFSRRAVVEHESGAELSYPFLLQAPDGLIHLVYTWKRARIRHVAFNAAWLDGM